MTALNNEQLPGAIKTRRQESAENHAILLKAIEEHAVEDLDLDHDEIISFLKGYIESTNEGHRKLIEMIEVHIPYNPSRVPCFEFVGNAPVGFVNKNESLSPWAR